MTDFAALLSILRCDSRQLYGVLDTARSSDYATWLKTRTRIPHACLFSGVKEVTLEHVAPYLLQFDTHHPFFEQVVKALWGRSCLLFLHSSLDMYSLRLELKKRLSVEMPNEARGLLRFYDPRVLHRLIAIANEDQRLRLLCNGDFRFICEANEGSAAMEYWYEQSMGFASLMQSAPHIAWRQHTLTAADGNVPAQI